MAYDRVMPDRVAENGFIMHRDEHQWYWLSAQTPKEPMAFVVWDSDDFGRDNSLMAPGEQYLNPIMLVRLWHGSGLTSLFQIDGCADIT